jgi:hypothetical protein
VAVSCQVSVTLAFRLLTFVAVAATRVGAAGAAATAAVAVLDQVVDNPAELIDATDKCT